MTGGRDASSAARRALAQGAALGVMGRTAAQTVTDAAQAARIIGMRVNATILPRRIEIARDGVPRMVCDAASGRLLGFAPAGAEIQRVKGPDDAAALTGFADLVARIFDNGGAISLRAQKPDIAAVDAGTGLAGSALFAQPEAGQEHVFQQFIDAAGPAIEAAAWLDGEMLYPLKGTEFAVDALAERIDILLQGIDALPGGLAGPPALSGLLLLGGTADCAPMLLGQKADRFLIAQTASANAPQLLQLWARTRHAA